MNIIDTLKNMIISLSTSYITPEFITDTTDLISDLSFNSITIVQLVINIEKEFNFEFDDEKLGLDEIVKFDNLVKYVSRKVEEVQKDELEKN